MKKSFVLLSMLALGITMGIPQCAFAQTNENKVKKVKYLGHKYKGQVNKKKIPEGEGVIDFPGYRVYGTFNENNITNAKCYIDANCLFQGNIVFDESDHFTLKSGGVVDCHFFIWNGFHVEEDGEVKDTLKQDFSSEEIYKNYRTITLHNYKEIDTKIRSELEPPHWFLDITAPHSTVKEEISYNTYNYISGYIIEKDSLNKEREIDIRNYKDDKGRIWDYHYIWHYNLNNYDVYYKVTYPNGSFLNMKSLGGHERVQDLKIVFSDGGIVECHNNGWDSWAFTDNGLQFNMNMWEYGLVDLFVEKGTYKFEISEIYIDNDIINLDSLSDSEVANFINTSMNRYRLEWNYKAKREVYKIKPEKLLIGKMSSDGEYTSEATRLAEEAKKEAEKEAKKNKAIQSFTRRFGFNPMGKSWKQIIAPGHSFSLVREFCNFYMTEINPNNYAWQQNYSKGFELSIDQGSDKCYDIWEIRYFDGNMYKEKHLGFLWVRGDKISSVSWY